MSMYKNIFVNEDWEAGSSQIQGINGEILVFGETAFSSVEQAIAAVGDSNAIVIKVASGKYDGFTVVTDGVAATPDKVIAVDFDGGEMVSATGTVSVASANFEMGTQLDIIADLNANNAANGTVYVLGDSSVGADTTILVGAGVADYVAGVDAAAVYGSTASDIVTMITGVNQEQNISLNSEVESNASATTITVGEGGQYATFAEAMAAVMADSTITRIELTSDVNVGDPDTENYYDISQDLSIGSVDGGNFTVIKNGATIAIRAQDGHTVTVDDDVTVEGLDVVANGFATSNDNLYINGEISAVSLKQWTNNGEIVVGETGKVTLGYGDGQFDMAYGNGSVTVNGTGDKTSAQFKAGYSGTRGSGNTLNLNDTYFEAGAWFNVNGSNGTINADNSLLKVSGGDGAGSLNVSSTGNVINMTNGSELNVANITLGAGNKIAIEDSSLKSTTLTNNGSVTVAGESTLNVGTLSGGETIDFLDGAVINDSTVGGGVFVAGDVTFRGDNTFGMLYDYGTLTDYYGTSANMQWTVEAGASLTLTNTARYGLGYGDNVTVNGNIAAGGADAACAALSDENAENDVKSSFVHARFGCAGEPRLESDQLPDGE